MHIHADSLKCKVHFQIWNQSFLTFEVVDVKLAGFSRASDSSESFEFCSAQGVQPLVSGGVLDEPGLVTEPVVAVLPHAVEVGLVFAVVATGEAAILVKSVKKQNLFYSFLSPYAINKWRNLHYNMALSKDR